MLPVCSLPKSMSERQHGRCRREENWGQEWLIWMPDASA